MSKLLITALVCAGVLSACSTDTGMTYTARRVNIAGEPSAYRVTCSGVFESQSACTAAAAKICKEQQVVVAQAVDSVPGGGNPRQMTFRCGDPRTAARPAA
ncbi:hypothetical protein [Caballeronia sp. BCC1704]|uniref:hypothetical protein n=1 Tax=Caballeronia sp. BCC1704 TaxID=2676300 RepID=UPI00158C1713|nr:hypothetical protein [Caballeronia sp. BCC1704]